jgi:hypothetical protein
MKPQVGSENPQQPQPFMAVHDPSALQVHIVMPGLEKSCAMAEKEERLCPSSTTIL